MVRHLDVSPCNWNRRDRFRLEVRGGGQVGGREIWAELRGGGEEEEEKKRGKHTQISHNIKTAGKRYNE